MYLRKFQYLIAKAKEETKGETNVNNPHPISDHSPLVKNGPIVLTLLATKLLHPVAANEPPPYELIAWWKVIFSYLDIKQRDLLELSWMCRIFHDAIPGLPLFTSFPHPRYPTLKGLVDRLNHLGNDYVEIKAAEISIGSKVYIDRYGKDHTITKINPDGTYNITERNNVPLTKLKQKVIHILPSLLFIENGEHTIEIYQNQYGSDCNYVNINIPISIIGESREHCIVMGGLYMKGKEEDDVNVSDLTLRKSKEYGVYGCDASMHLDNVSVENSGRYGVVVNGSKPIQSSKRNTMKNCNVSHSKESGLYVRDGGLMTIDGNGTTIHHNGTNGYGYGLRTYNSSIHLVSPLTKEMISTNNHRDRNYSGKIQTITNKDFFVCQQQRK